MTTCTQAKMILQATWNNIEVLVVCKVFIIKPQTFKVNNNQGSKLLVCCLLAFFLMVHIVNT